MANEKNRDELSESIAKLDWTRCSKALAKLGVGADYLLERIIHSGSMVLQRGDAPQVARRDAFAAGVEAHLASLGATDELHAFRDHVRQSKLVESGYRAIQKTLQATTGDIAADHHVWGVLERLHSEILILKRNLFRELRKRKTAVDPVSLHLVGDDGGTFSPDAAASTFISTCVHRPKANTHSGRSRTVIPEHAERPFRAKANTDSGACRTRNG